MNYDSFTRELSLALKQIPGIPSEILFSSTLKNNGVSIKTLTIKAPDDIIAPSIHLDHYYELYKGGTDLNSIAVDIAKLYFEKPEFAGFDATITWERVKNHIIYTLVNYEANTAFLSTAPHYKLLDLAIVFKINSDFLNIPGLITINDSVLNHLAVDKERLLSVATLNTPFEYPISFMKLSDAVPKIPESSFYIPDIPNVFMVTNRDNCYGASTILYSELSDLLKEKGLEDCYVLPSSINELILVDISHKSDKEYYETMVKEINNSDVIDTTDYLSDTVYTYKEIKEAFQELLLK